MEHVNAFERHSQFRIWKVNTEFGFPAILSRLRFQIVLLHYSLFGSWPYKLDEGFIDYLRKCNASYKVAFFQDEYRFCQQRFSFINEHNLDCVYTRVRPAHFKDVYYKYTKVPKLIHTLAGYVSDELVGKGRELFVSPEKRRIDIGYRAYGMPFYMGRGAQEKTEIAMGFRERARNLDFKMDIEIRVQDRLYGKAWYRFLANCKACLGAEGGASIFDLEGVVYSEYKRLMASCSLGSFAEFEKLAGKVVRDWRNRVPYRTFTPRHFEAAVFRVCQILFEGEYSGMLKPMEHYIPMKKDFSNFGGVIRMFKDERLRDELTENAYRDLIASGKYSYKGFIESFDNELIQAGLIPGDKVDGIDKVSLYLNAYQTIKRCGYFYPMYYSLPARKLMSLCKRLSRG
jgi:hypothetical protein